MKWIEKEKVPKEFTDRFPEISLVIAQMLYSRGLQNTRQVNQFLNPEYEDLHDPYLFADMAKAVTKVWEAIEKKQKIVIYGDYDADAVTASAVMVQTFRYLNIEVESYIPDRFSEGYGLNLDAFQKLKERNIDLVVTVDCGTNSVAEAEFCKNNGIDLIITDHHEVTGSVPDAFSLINPKNPGEPYPEKQLTGVGVAYKFAQAILRERSKVVSIKGIEDSDYIEGWDKWLLDLVAIGTVADCHSLLGENRVLVYYGLKVMRKSKWIGLKQLIENSGFDLTHLEPDVRTLGFSVAPRINAAGRLEHAGIALDLLITQDYAQAITLSNRLEEINRRRQDLTSRLVSEAKEQADHVAHRDIILVAHKDWHQGVVGLAAGRLSDHYHKPVIVLSQNETESTGSARTSGDFDVVEALKFARQHMVKFGGHKQAAGLTVENGKVEDLYLALMEYSRNVKYEQSEKTLKIDSVIGEKDLSISFYEEVSRFEPFGYGNPTPVFEIQDAKVINWRVVGSTQKHLQLDCIVGELKLSCIGFNMAYLDKSLISGVMADLAGELIVDKWNGNMKLKFKLIDIKIHDQ